LGKLKNINDVTLFIAQQKSVLLKRYRDLQLTQRRCECNNVLKYIKGNENDFLTQSQELNQKLKDFFV